MNVNVTMATDDFLEFMEWMDDRERYQKEAQGIRGKLELFAKKVSWALSADPNPKRNGKLHIVDQEHAAELLEMAEDYLK